MSYYVIRVSENGNLKYVFNSRVMLEDISLAKHFSSLSQAKAYWKKLSNCSNHLFIPVSKLSQQIYEKTLGSIVE